ncbi:FecR family protein [Pedobacter gandavensis]|uniref:FecR family protein n=1 Tax=Pedobacter gandavensis TaxID=2679963 RepID=UPI00292E0A6D|nr:FecR domain-containing protein [Pedobacter gandavensis]
MHREDPQDKISRSFIEPELEFEVKRDLYQFLELQTESQEADPDFDPLYDKICHKIAEEAKQKQRKKVIKLMRYVLTRAAIFLLGILSYALVVHPYFYPKAVTELTLIAPEHAVTEAILPDGSKVFLNAKSSVRYHQDEKTELREVFLTGEAWFDVKKDKEHPFVVKTSGYSIKVHGTRFNVRAFPGDQELITTLQHGSVEILPRDEQQKLVPVMLKPGQQFVFYPATGKGIVTRVQAGIASLWKEKEIRFENKNFKDLLDMLEGRYNVRFVVKDQELFNYHYDGTIRDENLSTVLDILNQTLPFHYQRLADGSIQIEK